MRRPVRRRGEYNGKMLLHAHDAVRQAEYTCHIAERVAATTKIKLHIVRQIMKQSPMTRQVRALVVKHDLSVEVTGLLLQFPTHLQPFLAREWAKRNLMPANLKGALEQRETYKKSFRSIFEDMGLETWPTDLDQHGLRIAVKQMDTGADG